MLIHSLHLPVPGAPWEGFYTFPCGTSATPTISLGFSGQTYAIYPADFNLGTVEGDPSPSPHHAYS